MPSVGPVGALTTRNVVVKLGADVKDFTKEIGLVDEVLEGALETIIKVEQRMERLAKRASMGFAGLAASGLAISTNATLAASAWQDAFALIEKTVDAPKKTLRELDHQLRRMSLDIPVNANQLAGLGSLAGQLGVSTEAIGDFTEAAAMLGEATDLSAQGAIFQLSQFSNIMGTSEKKVQNLSSTLVALGNNTASTEASILNFSTRIAGVGSVVGLAEAEVMGIAAAMASAGVEAERGGTAVSKVLLSINEAATTGGKNLAVFAQTLGMTKEQFRETAKANPAETFALFVESLRDAGDQGVKVLQRLNLEDQRLVQSFLSLANSSQDVRSTMGLANDAFREGTALTDEFNKRANTLSSQFQKMRNAFADVSRGIGVGFVTPVKWAVQAITAMVNIFNALPQPIKTALGLIMGLGTAVSALAASTLALWTVWKKLGVAFTIFKLADKARQTTFFAQVIATLGGLVQSLVGGFRGMSAGSTAAGASAATAARDFNNLHGMLEKVGAMAAKIAPTLGRAFAAVAAGDVVQGLKLAKIGVWELTKAFGRLGRVILAHPYFRIAAVVTAAGWGLKKAWEAANETISRSEGALNEAAASMGVTATKAEDLKISISSLADAAEASRGEFIMMNQSLLDLYETIDSDEGRRAFLLNIATQMAGKDVPPEKIQEFIDNFQDSLDMDQRVDIGISVEEALDDPEAIVEAFVTRVQQVAGRTNLWAAAFGKNATRGETKSLGESLATDLLSALKNQGSITEQAKGLQTVLTQLRGIESAYHEMGRPGGTVAHASNAIVDSLIDIVNASSEAFDLDKGKVNATNSFTGFVEELVTSTENGQKVVRNLLKGMGIPEEELQTAEQIIERISSMTDEALLKGEFFEPRINLAKFSEDATQFDRLFSTAIAKLQGDDGALNAFLRKSLEDLAASSGHEQAIAVIKGKLRTIGEDLADQMKDPMGRTLISVMESLQQELDRISFDNIRREIDSLPLDEAIAKIDQVIAKGGMAADMVAQLQEARLQKINAEFSNLQNLLLQEEQLGERLADLDKDHAERLKDLAENEKKAVEQHERNLAKAFDVTRRVQSQATLSLASLLFNMGDQREMLTRWRSALDQLSAAGLDQDLMEDMGLTDPKNWQQAVRFARDAMANPQLIDEINSEWSQRLDIVGSTTEAIDPALKEITDRFAEQREEIIEQYNETRQDIQEQIADLGKSMAIPVDEALARAAESGSEHIKKLGEMLSPYLQNQSEDAAKEVIKDLREIAKESEKLRRILEDDFTKVKRHNEAESEKLRRILEDDFRNAGDNVVDFWTGPGGVVDKLAEGFRKIAEDAEGSSGIVATAYSSNMSGGGSGGSSFGGSTGRGGHYAGDGSDGSFDPAGIGGGSRGSVEGSAEYKRMAYSAMLQMGWDHGQWSALHELVSRESSWSPTAQNPNSTAYGLFQFLDATWKTVGGSKTSDPREQIRLGLKYIDQRYGSPGAALSFHDKNNWYAAGAVFTGPKRIGVGEAGPEAVIPLNARGVGIIANAFERALPRWFLQRGGGGGGSSVTKVHNEYKIMGDVVASDPNQLKRQMDQRRRLNAIKNPAAMAR